MTGTIIFITGGVRSGKSAFAEQLAARIPHERAYYIATSEAFDDEMKARIARHQQDRLARAVQWETIEAPRMMPQLSTRRAVILVECITTWLANAFYYENDVEQAIAHLLQAIIAWREAGHAVIVVSNEVLEGEPSPYVETEQYKKRLGLLHQHMVQLCDEAYEMNFTITQQWK